MLASVVQAASACPRLRAMSDVRGRPCAGVRYVLLWPARVRGGHRQGRRGRALRALLAMALGVTLLDASLLPLGTLNFEKSIHGRVFCWNVLTLQALTVH